MAASATPRPADTVAVAYSGGLDSSALLLSTARQGAALGLRVLALHVHHGLMAEAETWVAHAEDFVHRLSARGWPVELRVARLSSAPAAGDSVEAWARRERYAALAAMAHAEGASLILLGQHLQDQAETVLLQALRGAGPAGLAAMPARWQQAGLSWARPWLRRPRAALRALLQAEGLQAIEDPSNRDPRFARSRLRVGLMPHLREQFPQTDQVLAEVARHAAQARALAEEVAAQDLPPCRDAQGRLRHGPWSALSPARRRNALAAWLAGLGWREGVPVSLVDRLMLEWTGLGRRWPAPGGWLRSQGRCLAYEPSSQAK